MWVEEPRRGRDTCLSQMLLRRNRGALMLIFRKHKEAVTESRAAGGHRKYTRMCGRTGTSVVVMTRGRASAWIKESEPTSTCLRVLIRNEVMESPNSNHQGDTDPEGQNNFWCSTAGSWDSAYEDHPSLDLRKVHDLLPDVKLLLTHLIDAGSSLILP